MNAFQMRLRRYSCLAKTALVSVVLVGHLLTSNANAEDAKPVDRKGSELFTFIAFDSFDGKARLKWQPVRHVPSHVSFTKNPGKLTITTQRGSIHRDERNDAFGEGIQAKNIFLIDNPLAPETNFVLSTCVSGFTPATRYQQAGLIIYNDDDNYLKWGYEYNWPSGVGQAFCILVETDAKSRFTYVDSLSGLDKYWVRLTKRGNRYEYAFSTDGKDFKVRGEQQWGDGAPRRMGLLAKNGGNKEAGELDAQFEFFELRSPVPADVKPKQ